MQISIQAAFVCPEWTLIFVDHNVMITFHIMALHSSITREDLLPSSKVYEFEMFRKCTIFADSFDDRSGLFCGARSMDQFTQLNLNNTSPFLRNGAVFQQLNETIQLSPSLSNLSNMSSMGMAHRKHATCYFEL